MENKRGKVLIIAPHPDDEINLAGQFSVTLIKLGYTLFTLYTTNGDYDKKIGNKRLYEAIKANGVLGIEEKNVIFLGYANEWIGNKHIYNAEPDNVLVSKLGKTKTNSIPEHHEYCYTRYGVHHDFTRNNLKSDYKNVILELMPDVLICPEFDSHPDHRAASLLFDEILGEILKDNKCYKPLVLKKYIHEGVWNGPKDYYKRPMIPTITKGIRYYSGGMHELDSPCFKWNDRVRFKADTSTTTDLLRKNIVFKAAKQHKYTTAWYEMQRVLNGDIVYWKRRTANLLYYAKIQASSGKIEYLNDFKLYDSLDISDIKEPFNNNDAYCWIPDSRDREKEILITFDKEECFDALYIIEDCCCFNHIEELEVIINGTSTKIELNNDGTVLEYLFPTKVYSDHVKLRVLKYKGIPGIAEVVLCNNREDIINNTFLAPEAHKDVVENVSLKNVRDKGRILPKIECIVLKIEFLLKFKLKYEVSRLFVK